VNLQLPRDELPAEEWLSIKSIIRDLVLEDRDWAADPPRRVLSPPFISVLRDLRASPSPSGRQVSKASRFTLFSSGENRAGLLPFIDRPVSEETKPAHQRSLQFRLGAGCTIRDVRSVLQFGKCHIYKRLTRPLGHLPREIVCDLAKLDMSHVGLGERFLDTDKGCLRWFFASKGPVGILPLD